MPALRTLGMVILAIFVASLGVLGYRYVRFAISDREAKEAALKLDASVQFVVTTGNPQVENVRIPDGYTMRFVDNQIVIDGFRVPNRGYGFADNCPELGAGDHSLSIKIENIIKNLVIVKLEEL
jgi:hypothetical protein